MMKRIIWHWTAGAPGVIPMEADAYHFIIGWPDGTVTEGMDPPEANIPPLQSGKYAAHTRNANSWAVGVSIDAMAGAVERPFSPGKYPITHAQVSALVSLTADLCQRYGIAVTRETVLSHAEVQTTLGIKQRNKWDIMWLPDMDGPDDPVLIGDMLRRMVSDELAGPAVPPARETPVPRGLAALIAAIMRWLTGGK